MLAFPGPTFPFPFLAFGPVLIACGPGGILPPPVFGGPRLNIPPAGTIGGGGRVIGGGGGGGNGMGTGMGRGDTGMVGGGWKKLDPGDDKTEFDGTYTMVVGLLIDWAC